MKTLIIALLAISLGNTNIQEKNDSTIVTTTIQSQDSKQIKKVASDLFFKHRKPNQYGSKVIIKKQGKSSSKLTLIIHQ